MTTRARTWVYPHDKEKWLRAHYLDHVQESGERVAEINELDHTNCMVGVYLSANQENLVDATWTTVALNTEEFDLGSHFNTTTYTFTAPMTRRYMFSFGVKISFPDSPLNTQYGARLYKGGATSIGEVLLPVGGDATEVTIPGSRLIPLTAGDTVVLQAISNSGDNTADIVGGLEDTWLSVWIVG